MLSVAVHFHHFHGPAIDYLGLAIAALVSWIGLPGPGEPVLIATAVLAARHHLDITGVLAVAWVAAVVGGIAGWLVGMWGGRRVLTFPGPLRRFREGAVKRGDRIFERHPVVAVVVTPSFVAGIHRVPAVLYLVITVVTAALWAVGIGLAAYYVGPSIVDLVGDLGLVTGIGLGVIVTLAVGGEIFRRRRRRAARRSAVESGRVEPDAGAG